MSVRNESAAARDGAPKRGARGELALAARAVLPLDPDAHVAIKRDVRSLEVLAGARDVASALHDAIVASPASFGPMRLVRCEASVGEPLAVGERFEEHYSDERDVVRPLHERLTRFGEIVELALPREGAAGSEREQYRLRHRFLQGSPIAGTSTYLVEPLREGSCRVVNVLEYQERQPRLVRWFGTRGLKAHHLVVYAQVRRAADAIGSRVLATDLPCGHVEIG